MLKKLKISLILLGVLLSCSASNAELIRKGCVGLICVGMDKGTLKRNFPRSVIDETIKLEGDLYPALRFKYNEAHSTLLELDERNKIFAIRVTDEYFTTTKGVRIGSNYSEVISKYSDAILKFGEEDGGYISLYIPSLNGYFSFGTEDIFIRDNSKILKNSQLRNKRFKNLKINLIYLHN